jgi:hypothetical protein
MKHILVFPLRLFVLLLRRFAESPKKVVCCIVGRSGCETETHYLIRRIKSEDEQLSARDRESSMTVSTNRFETHNNRPPTLPGLGHLFISPEGMTGEWRGWIQSPSGAIEPLDYIPLVGAGMHILKSGDASNQDVPIYSCAVHARLSRTIGAMGFRHWRRFIRQRIAVIGCGRSGSIAAATLVKMGMGDITLIDPDVVEIHNIGEMDCVTEADIGKLKVDALAGYLRSHGACASMPLQIKTVANPITAAYKSALSADVLVCCVDNDAARLACGILATRFHKVLLDIGTGIRHDGKNGRQMGIDVRLILPADGCLHCFGSVANYDEALIDLIRRKPPNDSDDHPWWVRRDGSLTTLNMMAVSIGLQLLCDLVTERVRDSRWIQVEYDESGSFTVEHFKRGDTAPDYCPLCAKSGMGEDGLLWE